MITKKELSGLTIHLKPHRYRCISKGYRFNNGLDDYDYEDLYYDYVNTEELNILQKIWFEIIGVNEKLDVKHIGYITGYYVDVDGLILYEESESFFEFDGNSHLTMELWEYIHESKIGDLESNYYFMNSITIDKYYSIPEIESAAINLIKNALYEIYRYDINTIIYSIDRTELDDDTVGKDYGNRFDEISCRAHRKNLLQMGFESFKDNKEEIYLYKSFVEEENMF